MSPSCTYRTSTSVFLQQQEVDPILPLFRFTRASDCQQIFNRFADKQRITHKDDTCQMQSFLDTLVGIMGHRIKIVREQDKALLCCPRENLRISCLIDTGILYTNEVDFWLASA